MHSGIVLPLLLAACTAIPSAPPPAPGAAPAATHAVPKPAPPLEPADFILTGEARQGGVMRGTAHGGTKSLTFDGTAIPLADDGQFLIAFDRDAGVNALLVATLYNGDIVQRGFAVKPGEWRIEYIDASPTANIPTEAFLARRRPELERIAAARRIDSGSQGWRQGFRWPVTGRISGLFGAQRVYRGEPGSYHSGTDIARPAGTPFVAPADGVVVLAAKDPFTLEGHLLIIDHGMGLNSAFLHCQSLDVREGDVVRQGQRLGRIGMSGRATGPHLHWGLKWRDSRLDPMHLAGPVPAQGIE